MLSLTLSPKMVLLGVLCLAYTCGCAEEKRSLFEHDHELPEHWPKNMADAADKIQLRLKIFSDTNRSDAEISQANSELEDLVQWAPEIAADTDLREEDWNPIYQCCETLRRHLNAGDVPIEAFREDFERLIGLLREANSKADSGSIAVQ